MTFKKHLHKLLTFLVEKSGSDLFLTTDFPPAIKLNGELHTLSGQLLTREAVNEFVAVMTTESQRAAFTASHELNFAYEVEELARFRVNIMRQKGREAIVVRRIPSHIATPQELGLPEILKDIALLPRGLVLIAGATGSGKSTTLATMVDHRNRNSAGHIITVEDPIEFVHSHQRCMVHQREIGMDTDSWQAALKNALRQAPDMILVGEIRDRETMEHAIAFAETGHLCLATLHSNNAVQALDRVLNFFPTERHPQLLCDLSLNLKAVVSQRLVPLVDGSARLPAVEVLTQTPFVSTLIARGEFGSLKAVMEKDLQAGMRTFDQSLCQLEETGKISAHTAIAFAESANNVRLKMQLRGREALLQQAQGTAPGLVVRD
jgi:twitching motility protein PilU